jgi:hypothetical protein
MHLMLLYHLKRIKAAHAGRWALPPRRAAGRRSSLLQRHADRPQEHFLTVTLSGVHTVTAIWVVSVGLVTRTLVSSCGNRTLFP